MQRNPTPTGAPLPRRGPSAWDAPRPGGRRHAGVDLWVARRTGRARSPVTGRVVVAQYTPRPGPWGGYAPLVVIRAEGQEGPEWHILAHLAEIRVQPGDVVEEGQVVGRGSSVVEGAPHIHWEIRRGRLRPRYAEGERPRDLAVPPAEWLAEREQRAARPTEPGPAGEPGEQE